MEYVIVLACVTIGVLVLPWRDEEAAEVEAAYRDLFTMIKGVFRR